MLRALVCLFSLFAISITSYAYDSSIACSIKSDISSDLEKGMNRDVLCEDMIRALEKQLNKKFYFGSIEAKNTWNKMYEVGMEFTARVNRDRYTGKGYEYWNPDQNDFYITKLEKLEPQIDCKVRSRHKQLRKGWNKETMCADLTEALEQKLGTTVRTAKIRIQEHWMRTFRVGVTYSVKLNGKRYKGNGIQFWDPDGHSFVIQQLKD